MKVYDKEIWFLTGSQHLYGEETLKQVKTDSVKIAEGLDKSGVLSAKIVFKALLTTADQIAGVCREASSSDSCMGVITWMHTFSPSQMWVRGLAELSKPLLHFHTQFNRDIPWADIDMNFMNLNQSAHGGREYGFIMSRMGIDRKVVVGHWEDREALKEIDVWIRAAAAWDDAQGARIARFGDNMRNVAVTEGDKVEALIRMGYQVEGYSTGDLIAHIDKVSEQEVKALTETYLSEYTPAAASASDPGFRASLLESAKIELGMLSFLQEGGFKAFTTNFENLFGIAQLPGLASQRLMAAGYGFGAEGDWKTSALLRAMKVMDRGLSGGTSFMEDYTYHLDPDNTLCLGAHMLEVCPSIASVKPVLDVQPLGIGGKADPARLRFTVSAGDAVAASLMDMGNRFRLLVNELEVVSPLADLPRLPVACVLWKPLPDLKTSAQAWILAGGAHHTSFSKALTTEHLRCWADIAGIELVVIDKETAIPSFKDQLRWNEMYYGMKGLARNFG